MFLGPTSEIS